jgi:CubicO group peptidase (beta-lactamase class C family)
MRASRVALSALREAMAGYVERGQVPGVVTVVSHAGDVHVDALGARSIGGQPMTADTIVRLSSLTKPIAAAAAMALVDDGRLALDEPIDRLLPELSNRRVLVRIDGALDDTVPARRPITVQDLLTFRMGFGTLLRPAGSTPIQRALGAERLVFHGPPKPAPAHAPDEWLRRFSTLPLMHQPGESWMYDTGAFVLGILIARATGRTLEAFLRGRLFEPLGMSDTGFSVPPAKLGRLASVYQFDGRSGTLELHDGVEDSQWREPPVFPDAAGGLVSTAADYLAFAQMMSNKGIAGSERILSAQSVEAMTTDHLTAEQRAGGEPFLDGGRGWGYGVSILPKPGDLRKPWRYGWDGGYGTSWYNDATSGAIGILMTQRLVFPESSGIEHDFWAGVDRVTGP